MRIAIDAHGGDFGLEPNIAGALRAAKDFGVEIAFVGDEAEINAAVKRISPQTTRGVCVVPAKGVAGMGAEPVQEIKDKPECSVMVCAGLIKEGKADAMVSAGNSGATMVAAFMTLGRIKGISRPAIAVALPTVKGLTLLVDAGANTDCKPLHLLHFALMGSIYMEQLTGISRPSIGILSVGEEETKGNSLVKEAIPLLKSSGLNYAGPVEGRDIPFHKTDVVVCDGFTGNIALKLYEGAAKAVMQIIKDGVSKSIPASLGMLMAKPVFAGIKKTISPDKAGGAPLLGVNGAVIISHGRSGESAVYNAVNAARMIAAASVNEKIRAAAQRLAETCKAGEAVS
ncbi:MAG: phosphate acyltransferase PlsX [Elusimicrobiales bacterium]